MLQLPPLPSCLTELASSLLYPSTVNAPISHSFWWMFDKNISNPNPLAGGSCFQLTVQKPMWQTLWKVMPFHKNFCVLSLMSFFAWFCCLFGFISLLIVLYWVSAHPWHCDLLCCFIWHLSEMQLVVTALFISRLYEQSQHLFENIAQLLRGSFQITWNFPCFFLAA